MLRGRRDRYHRLGFIIAFTVAAIATPVQMGVGDGLARWVYSQPAGQVRRHRDGADRPAAMCPRPCSAISTPPEKWRAASPSPGLASWLSDPSTGRATVVQGLDTVPADQRPTNRQVNVVHLCWDIMVGLGTLLFLLTLWYWASWIFRRDMPRSRWFLRVRRRLRASSPC